MFVLLKDNLLLLILITCLIIFFIWLGWKIRLWWKNFLFMLLRKRGKKGEITALKLLEKKGYRVLDEQIKLCGYFFINDKLKKFDLRPDLLVEKDGVRYIAEVKTGEAADPANVQTRRQLHEYSYYGNQNVVLLVDPIKKSIKFLSFKKK